MRPHVFPPALTCVSSCACFGLPLACICYSIEPKHSIRPFAGETTRMGTTRTHLLKLSSGSSLWFARICCFCPLLSCPKHSISPLLVRPHVWNHRTHLHKLSLGCSLWLVFVALSFIVLPKTLNKPFAGETTRMGTTRTHLHKLSLGGSLWLVFVALAFIVVPKTLNKPFAKKPSAGETTRMPLTRTNFLSVTTRLFVWFVHTPSLSPRRWLPRPRVLVLSIIINTIFKPFLFLKYRARECSTLQQNL